MPEYPETSIENVKEALGFSKKALDGRTKEARKLKQIKSALNDDFDSALKEILEHSIAINLVVEKKLVDQGLETGDLKMSSELKALRKDTMDRLKMLEKIKKNKQFTKNEDQLASLILGEGDNE